MKTIIHQQWIVLFSILLLLGCTGENPEFHLSDFQDPPEASNISTLWFWMHEAISREGITRDLESMKEQGIAGAYIFNCGLGGEQDFGVPRVPFDSPQWYEMFGFALQEAKRFGIEIGMHNCDGWSSSGGPWIKPEQSMKQIIWSTSQVEGGKKVSVKLRQAVAKMDFYKDVAVIAYPAVQNYADTEGTPEIVINDSLDGSFLTDGEPMSHLKVSMGDRICFSFMKPRRITKVAIHPHMTFSWGMARLNTLFDIEVSDNGRIFRKHASVRITDLNKTSIKSIPPVTAAYFRIIPGEIKGLAKGMVNISELELLNDEESPRYSPSITYHLEKTVALEPHSMAQMVSVDSLEMLAAAVDAEEVIDLSEQMTQEGTLEWEAPAGKWTIVRFGYTTTGSTNVAATEQGTGLEVDKMDTIALNHHFRSFPGKLINTAGALTGNTFGYLHIDSWECKYQNWTERFSQEFEKRRGYSMLSYMPVLCGAVVGSADRTEAFLNDYRLTIADLIEENYFRHFRDLCHRNNMEFHAEAIYGGSAYPPVDVLSIYQYADVPMSEFWAVTPGLIGYESTMGTYSPSVNLNSVNPAHACAVYNKSLLACEAWTGYAQYSETPWDLKPYGDMAFSEGVNRMVLSSYVHQPDDRKPGFTLRDIGLIFNRHNTWWQHFNRFTTYLARQQYILQQGQPHADICYFVGDRMPDFQARDPLYHLPYGYEADHINPDLLINRLKMENGKLTLGQAEYRLLLLPPDNVMSLKTLQKLERLVKAGAIVSGPKPAKCLSLASYESDSEELVKLAGKLWGETDGSTLFENNYGKGKVIWGRTVEEILERENMLPDLENNDPEPENFRYIHKRMGTQDIYYIFNQIQSEKQVEFLFNVSGKTPTIYDPMSGEVQACMAFTREGLRTRVPLHFRPWQTYFVVFDERGCEGECDQHIAEILQAGKKLFPSGGIADETVKLPTLILKENMKLEVLSASGGDYTLVSGKGNNYQVNIPPAETFTLEEFSGTISFHDNDRTIEIGNLKSFTEYDDPFIRYFSGTASYRIPFDLPDGWAQPDHAYYLHAGETGASAEISLNGSLLDVVWEPDHPIRMTVIPEAGSNMLEVKTTNTWRNRLIGDFSHINEPGKAWTTCPIDIFMDENTEPSPAGFRGPVRLVKYPAVVVELE